MTGLPAGFVSSEIPYLHECYYRNWHCPLMFVVSCCHLKVNKISMKKSVKYDSLPTILKFYYSPTLSCRLKFSLKFHFHCRHKMLWIAYHLLSTLLVEFLGLLSRSIARSVSRNWVPVADIKSKLADAFITRNKCVKDVIAITHEGSLNCNLRLSHLFICNERRIVYEYQESWYQFCNQRLGF